jgi:hypothetical protein
MKKIIAAAVATAFVAPVMAAEVTVSGDIEYILKNTSDVSGTAASYHDSDIFVSATEDLGNGLTVTLKQGFEDIQDNSNKGDTELTIGGVMGGSLAMGEVDSAAALFDEGASVAESGGAYADYQAAEGGDMNFVYTVSPMENLTVALSVEIDNSASSASVNASENLMHQAYAVKYVAGGATVFAAQTSYDTESGETQTVDDASLFGVSYASGPFYVSLVSLENGVVDLAGASSSGNTAGLTDGTYFDATTLGVTYDYGQGKIFYESNSLEVAGAADRETTIMGASYKLGSLNLYVQTEDENVGAGDDDNTAVGVEYAF